MKSFRSLSSRHYRIILILSLLGNTLLIVKLLHLFGGSDCPQLTPKEVIVKTDAVVRRELEADNGNSNNYSSYYATKIGQIVFVGGVPRSGTTLARVMLDAHPDIRCGEETRVIPRIISMRSRWDRAAREHQRLMAAGLSDSTLDQATRAFISEIILNHGPPAKYLCNKDPLVLNYMNDIMRLFPKAKFILMVRDGRAVAYSIVTRNVTISGVDSRNYMSAALFWNKVVERMLRDCKAIGSRCLKVFYEDLVAEPKVWMEKILSYLEIPWHDNVLRHHELINSEVSLSK